MVFTVVFNTLHSVDPLHIYPHNYRLVNPVWVVTRGYVVWCGFDESDFVAARLNGRACARSMSWSWALDEPLGEPWLNKSAGKKRSK